MTLHHVGFLTKNLEQSRTDFLKLGFEVEKPVAFDNIRKINIEFLVNGGYRVELVEPAGKDSPLYPLLKRFKNMPYHFCYESKDFDYDLDYLSSVWGGYHIIDEVRPAPCLDGRKVCFLMGSGSGIIELVDMS